MGQTEALQKKWEFDWLLRRIGGLEIGSEVSQWSLSVAVCEIRLEYAWCLRNAVVWAWSRGLDGFHIVDRLHGVTTLHNVITVTNQPFVQSSSSFDRQSRSALRTHRMDIESMVRTHQTDFTTGRYFYFYDLLRGDSSIYAAYDSILVRVIKFRCFQPIL